MTRIKRGKYEIERRGRGGFLIYGVRQSGEPKYVQSRKEILEKYRLEGESGEVRRQLSLLGLTKCGRYNLPLGRRLLELPGPELGNVKTTDKEIIRAIKKAWPDRTVNRLMNGKNVKVMSIKEFRKKNHRQWHSAHRTHGKRINGSNEGGLKTVMESIYPGLYDKIAYQGSRIITSTPNKEKVARDLLDKYSSGTINKTALLNSSDPKDQRLFKEVRYWAAREGISYTAMVEKLTGLKERDITSHPESRKLAGLLTEEMTRFIVLWSKVMGIDASGLDLKKELYMSEQERTIRNGQDYLADLRLGNDALEVKCGLGQLDAGIVKKVKHVYKVGESKWSDGKTLDGATVIFYQSPHLYSSFKRDLQKQGIQVLGFKWSENLMKKIVRNLKRNHSPEIEDVRPRVNLDYLLESHREISLNPRNLYMMGNLQRLQWTIDQFRGLNTTGEKIYESA